MYFDASFLSRKVIQSMQKKEAQQWYSGGNAKTIPPGLP